MKIVNVDFYDGFKSMQGICLNKEHVSSIEYVGDDYAVVTMLNGKEYKITDSSAFKLEDAINDEALSES